MFLEVCDSNSFHTTRAFVATLFNAALLANSECASLSIERTALTAIAAADELLSQLGVVNPDTVVAD